MSPRPWTRSPGCPAGAGTPHPREAPYGLRGGKILAQFAHVGEGWAGKGERLPPSLANTTAPHPSTLVTAAGHPSRRTARLFNAAAILARSAICGRSVAVPSWVTRSIHDPALHNSTPVPLLAACRAVYRTTPRDRWCASSSREHVQSGSSVSISHRPLPSPEHQPRIPAQALNHPLLVHFMGSSRCTPKTTPPTL